MAQNVLTLSVIAVLVISVGVSAKRGCSSFGHSCFGGHGKRSDAGMDEERKRGRLKDEDVLEVVKIPTIRIPKKVDARPVVSGDLVRQQPGQEETPPHPGYPHSYGMLPDDIIPIRDGGALDRDESNVRDVVKIKLRNILKYWMDTYRRSRLNEDGYYIETL